MSELDDLYDEFNDRRNTFLKRIDSRAREIENLEIKLFACRKEIDEYRQALAFVEDFILTIEPYIKDLGEKEVAQEPTQ